MLLPQALPEGSNWEIDLLCSRMLHSSSPRPLPPLLFLTFYFSLSLYFSDKDDLSAEMKEFVAVQLFGVQTILGKSTTADCDTTVAYDTICRVRDKWAQWPLKLHLNVFLLPAIVQHLLYCE